MRLLISLLGLFSFVGALVLGWKFASANADKIQIDLVWTQVPSIAVWQLALLSFGAGMAAVLSVSAFLGTRGWLLRRRYRRTIRGLESELHQMRSLPLASRAEIDSDDATARVARG
jgi:hypothetical protein